MKFQVSTYFLPKEIMEKNDRAEKLLGDIRSELKAEGVKLNSSQDQQELIDKYIIPALESSKDIQRHLYTGFTSDGNMLRRIKNKVIQKIANVTRNTVEKSFMKQQKFNDNVFQLLGYLLNENKKLKEELAKQNRKDGK